jgi:hypothetical protein
MARNSVFQTLVIGLVGMTFAGSAFGYEKVRDDVASQVSTLSLDHLILREAFDDNKTANIWRVWADDVNNCWISEANKRLEVQAKSAAADAFAGYVAYAWRMDPQADFSMKVEFHHDLKTMGRTWLSLGITPDAKHPRNKRISMDAQCVSLCKSFRYEFNNGDYVDTSVGERPSDDGTLYVSYDSAIDTLYVSTSGYGEDHAWGTFPGVLKGQWGGQPVSIWCGGGSSGQEIASGRAYLDNLQVETGTIVEASLQEVYHFKRTTAEKHFYTMSKAEKEQLLKDKSWAYVGVAFYAYPDDSDPDCKPVYRFWSDRLKSHFYTISEGEKNGLIGVWGWIYEGVSFFAYPVGEGPDWSLPVYRFWSSKYGSHYYTIDEADKANLIKNSSNFWTFENAGWYAVK